MRTCWIRPFPLIVVAAAVAFVPQADAQRSKTSAKLHAAALSAWRACFADGANVPAFPDEDDLAVHQKGLPGYQLTVRRTRAGFHVAAQNSGSGRDAVYSGLRIDFEPRGCRALWVRDANSDGALAWRTRIGWVNRSAPTDGELQILLGATPARAEDPVHALPRAWLAHTCPGGPESTLEWKRAIEGPIAPAQPWRPGAPRHAPSTFWSIAALDAVGAGAHERPSDDDEDLSRGSGPEIAGILVPAFSAKPPKVAFKTAGVELFETAIGGRNEGRAIAIYDPVAKRHRWVVVTRGCVQGTTVTWAGAVGKRIVGVTRSRAYSAGDAILIIDVPSGTAWAIRLPTSIARAYEDNEAQLRASLSGSQLALQIGPAASTLDLAPMLASIPAP